LTGGFTAKGQKGRVTVWETVSGRLLIGDLGLWIAD
jgi:hypothetical protein